jgi:phosphoglycolate phosphatase-like HAD superfamily hydrolase
MPSIEHLLKRPIQKRPDAVLFDWDDTLFDHAHYVHELSIKLMDAIGEKPHPSVEEMNALWHKNKDLCCKTYFPGHTPDDVLKVWGKFMKEMPQERLVLFPDTIEVLESLKSKGIPILMVSNKGPEILHRELEHFGLSHYFEAIVGGHDERKNRKPSFYPIEKALNEANNRRLARGEKKLMLGNLWYVGDHSDDAGAARSDGIQRFIVGEKNHDIIKNHHDDNDPLGGIVYLKGLNEFKDILNSIPDEKRENVISR